jgi:hypothetical protein
MICPHCGFMISDVRRNLCLRCNAVINAKVAGNDGIWFHSIQAGWSPGYAANIADSVAMYGTVYIEPKHYKVGPPPIESLGDVVCGNCSAENQDPKYNICKSCKKVLNWQIPGNIGTWSLRYGLFWEPNYELFSYGICLDGRLFVVPHFDEPVKASKHSPNNEIKIPAFIPPKSEWRGKAGFKTPHGLDVSPKAPPEEKKKSAQILGLPKTMGVEDIKSYDQIFALSGNEEEQERMAAEQGREWATKSSPSKRTINESVVRRFRKEVNQGRMVGRFTSAEYWIFIRNETVKWLEEGRWSNQRVKAMRGYAARIHETLKNTNLGNPSAT